MALRVLVLSRALDDVFPKSKVCVKTLMVLSNKQPLNLPKVLRRKRLSLIKWGEWRKKSFVDYASLPQLRIGLGASRKACLNLYSLKWF